MSHSDTTFGTTSGSPANEAAGSAAASAAASAAINASIASEAAVNVDRDCSSRVADASLSLGMIGNCAFSALIDGRGRVVWMCLPRFDGDPVFNALLDPSDNAGHFSIEIGERKWEYKTGDTVLIPAALKEFRLTGYASLLEVYVP